MYVLIKDVVHIISYMRLPATIMNMGKGSEWVRIICLSDVPETKERLFSAMLESHLKTYLLFSSTCHKKGLSVFIGPQMAWQSVSWWFG